MAFWGMNEKVIWFSIISSIVLLSGVTGITIYQDVFAGGGKVMICHKPGTPAENSLMVSQSAVRAHLAHGDTEGPCIGGGSGDTLLVCNCRDGPVDDCLPSTFTCDIVNDQLLRCGVVCAGLGGSNGIQSCNVNLC